MNGYDPPRVIRPRRAPRTASLPSSLAQRTDGRTAAPGAEGGQMLRPRTTTTRTTGRRDDGLGGKKSLGKRRTLSEAGLALSILFLIWISK